METFMKWLRKRDIYCKNAALIEEAITHSSYVNEHKGEIRDNERLEFIGDAVLQLWTSDQLFAIDPSLNEGEMTCLRAQLVCEEALAEYNRELQLGQFLKLGVGEEKNNGKERDSILADMFEAILGAIYLDQGMSAVDMILQEVITPVINQPKSDKVIDYKTKLQEYIQTDSRKAIYYETLRVEGPSNAPNFEIAVKMDGLTLGKGSGTSKKRAEQMAAKEALDKMAK